MTIKKTIKHTMARLNRGGRVGLPCMCFALLLCLTLTCATARGETLTWEEYAKEVRMLEEKIGDYDDWPIAEKRNLIQALVDMGHIRESSATTQLFEVSMSERSRHTLADQIMLRFLGGDSNPIVNKDGVRAICWESITDVILGNPSTWTLKEKVWYQQVTNMFGREDPDTFVLPNADDLPEKEAVAIAKAAIISAYGLAPDALDGFMPDANLYITNSSLFDEEPRPNYRRWDIRFLYYLYNQDGTTIVENYAATIDENGHVISDVETGSPHVRERAVEDKTRLDDATPWIVQVFREYAQSERCYFPWQWCVETKAEYSQQVRSQVLTALKKDDLSALTNASCHDKPIREIIDSTVFAYGLPEKEHLQEDDAFNMAEHALIDQYGFPDESTDQYVAYTSFDVTDPGRPLWKFLLCPKSFENMKTVLLYKVELNANTGDVIATNTIDWEHLFQDPAYDQLLY